MSNLSPMHVGAGRDTYDVASGLPASDALSAALAAMRALRGKDEDIGKWLESFAVSDAFPYCGEMMFLPKPQGRINVTTVIEEKYRKRLKKVKFIQSGMWSRVIAGEQISSLDENQLAGDYLLDCPMVGFKAPTERQTSERVKVSRAGLDSDPFAFSWTYFRQESGLYCIVDADDETFSELTTLFDDLGAQGFGSDRSVGGGHFSVSTGTFQLALPAEGNAQLLLSTFIPSEGKLPKTVLEQSRYQVLTRGGFMAGSSQDNCHHYRRNIVKMITSGSVLATTEPLLGKVLNLRPPKGDVRHDVWRSGRPVSVTIKTSAQ